MQPSATARVPRSPDPPRAAVRWGSLVVLASLAWNGLGQIRHELWRDELQAWALARDSDSLVNLLHNMRYEGHPPLWHTLLFPLAQSGAGPWTMQVTSLLVGAASVGVVWRWAPLPRWQRAGFAFAYIPAYEYTVISRTWGVGVLLLVSALAAACQFRVRWPLVGGLLGLLSLTTLFGAILATAVAAGLVIRSGSLSPTTLVARMRQPEVAGGAALLAAGLGTAALTTWTPRDAESAGWFLQFSPTQAGRALHAFWRGLVPLPSSLAGVRETNIFDYLPGPAKSLLALVLVVGLTLVLTRERTALTVWLVTLLSSSAVAYFKTPQSVRQAGTLFLAFLAAVWLARAQTARPRGRDRKVSALGLLIVAHVIAGLIVSVADLRRPFSGSEQAASMVHELDPAGSALLVGDIDYSASAVGIRLRREIYYPASKRSGTYLVWGAGRRCVAPAEEPRACLSKERLLADKTLLDAGRDGRRVLLLLTYPLRDSRLMPLGKTAEAITDDEIYWLYDLRPDDG